MEKYFCKNLEKVKSFIKLQFKNLPKLKIVENKWKDKDKIKFMEDLISQLFMHNNIQIIARNKGKRELFKNRFLKCRKVKHWSIFTIKKIDQLLKHQEKACNKSLWKLSTTKMTNKNRQSKN